MDRICTGRLDELDAEIESRRRPSVSGKRPEKVAELKERANASDADAEQDPLQRGSAKRLAHPPPRCAPAPTPPILDHVPTPPFWGDRVVEHIPLEQVYPFINETALFKTQWQFTRGNKSTRRLRPLSWKTRSGPIFDRLQARR